MNKESDIPGDNGGYLSSRGKPTILNLDQPQKGQLKTMHNEPVDKPKSMSNNILMSIVYYLLVIAFPNIPNRYNFSMVHLDVGTLPPVQAVDEDAFEPVYEEKKRVVEDYYLDMSEKFIKQYEQFLHSVKQNNSKDSGQSGNLGTARGQQSSLLEWSKLLQKQFSQEKSTASLQESKNKLSKAYKAIVSLDERNWYEEMVSLYKV